MEILEIENLFLGQKMLKLTMKNYKQFAYFPDEAEFLKKVLDYAKKHWIEIFIFGSRLNGVGNDIDLIISWDNLDNLKKIAFITTDAKVDTILSNLSNKLFIDTLKLKFYKNE